MSFDHFTLAVCAIWLLLLALDYIFGPKGNT